MRWMDNDYKSKLEEELDYWRSDCLEVFLNCVRDSNYAALEEIKETYALAREQHLLEYCNNRIEFCSVIYKHRNLNLK